MPEFTKTFSKGPQDAEKRLLEIQEILDSWEKNHATALWSLYQGAMLDSIDNTIFEDFKSLLTKPELTLSQALMSEQQGGTLDSDLQASRKELITRTSSLLASFSLSANVVKMKELPVSTIGFR